MLIHSAFQYGVLKPVSSTFVGASPEFEVALYTLCFYGGKEDNHVDLGPYSVNIKCYHIGRDKMGSPFPTNLFVESSMEYFKHSF